MHRLSGSFWKLGGPLGRNVPVFMRCERVFLCSSISPCRKVRLPELPNSIPEKAVRYLGQPSHLTHPGLVAANETTPGISRAEYASRRLHLFNNFVKSCSHNQGAATKKDKRYLILLSGADVTYYAPDVPHPFRQCSNFFYLTGFQEPGALLALCGSGTADDDLGLDAILGVAKSEPKKEKWEGPVAGIDGGSYLTGINDVVEQDEFWQRVEEFVSPSSVSVSLSFVPRTSASSFHNDTFDVRAQKVLAHANVDCTGDDLITLVHRLRWLKSAAELNLMRGAASIGSAALCATMAFAKSGMNENQLVGRFDYECRMRGARCSAYPPVVAGGNRANTIHYLHANQVLSENELVLMDAGCDYHGYVSDISRTFPTNVDGLFTGAQLALYEALCDVQSSLLSYVNDRRPFNLHELYFQMIALLGHNLREVGVVPRTTSDQDACRGKVKKAESENCWSVLTIHDQAASDLSLELLVPTLADRACPHHVGHYLGLDVHDTPTVPRNIPIEPNAVITVEPGIYFDINDTSIPKEFRGIGMRIEDDVIIHDNRAEVITAACPKESDDISDLIRKDFPSPIFR